MLSNSYFLQLGTTSKTKETRELATKTKKSFSLSEQQRARERAINSIIYILVYRETVINYAVYFAV